MHYCGPGAVAPEGGLLPARGGRKIRGTESRWGGGTAWVEYNICKYYSMEFINSIMIADGHHQG